MSPASHFRILIKGSASAFSGNGLIYALAFVFQLILLRFLGAENYGIWGFAYTPALTVAQLSVMGTGLAAAYFISGGKDTGPAPAEEGEGYSGIKGTWYSDRRTGNIERNPRRKLFTPEELWTMDTDYSLYGEKYFLHPFDGKMVRMFWLEVARGCPYNCTYCGNSALREAYKGLGGYVCERPMDSVFELLRESTVRSNAYFMIGFPTETRAEVFQTIELCGRIKSDMNVVSIFQPLPGQKPTEFCMEKGYITGREPMETFTSSSVLNMPQMSREEISGLRRTFLLHAKLPEDLRPLIEKCERAFEGNRKTFDEPVALRWEHEAGKKE